MLKLHNPGVNGQRIKMYQTIIFQGAGLRRSPVTETKGKGVINSHLQNISITCPLI